VLVIIAIGLSASFWVAFVWKAARSWSRGFVLLELPVLVVPVVLVELVLDPELEALLESLWKW
jgi:hypothetical protein